MSTEAATGYKLLKKVKSQGFDSKNLGSYTLCLMVGITDFQFCVTDKQKNECLYIEDYKLEGVRTINARLQIIQDIFNAHPLLRSYKWGSVKLTFKSQKFSLVPNSYFIPEVAGDYLILASEVNTKIDDVFYYRHISTPSVNIFTADKKVTEWVKTAYPSKNPQVIHQGSAFIEGIMKYDDHSHEKSMYVLIDRGFFHAIVSQDNQLLFYNQFTLKSSDEFLKYILTAFKELDLDPKSNALHLWGMISNNSPHLATLKKYIRNVSFGSKPNFLKFPGEFQDVENHRYFDVYSIFLCE